MSTAIETIVSWVGSFARDIEVAKAMVESTELSAEARKLAAAALGYLVTRMDLIPDWNETIGILDDVLVLRVCLDLASEHAHGAALDGYLDPSVRAELTRLCSDVELIQHLLGTTLYTRLRKHCARLGHAEVRGRSPASIVDQERQREALYREIAEDLARMPALSLPSQEADLVEARLRSYLHHKLSR